MNSLVDSEVSGHLEMKGRNERKPRPCVFLRLSGKRGRTRDINLGNEMPRRLREAVGCRPGVSGSVPEQPLGLFELPLNSPSYPTLRRDREELLRSSRVTCRSTGTTSGAIVGHPLRSEKIARRTGWRWISSGTSSRSFPRPRESCKSPHRPTLRSSHCRPGRQPGDPQHVLWSTAIGLPEHLPPRVARKSFESECSSVSAGPRHSQAGPCCERQGPAPGETRDPVSGSVRRHLFGPLSFVRVVS
jgi:hypothetical protein